MQSTIKHFLRVHFYAGTFLHLLVVSFVFLYHFPPAGTFVALIVGLQQFSLIASNSSSLLENLPESTRVGLGRLSLLNFQVWERIHVFWIWIIGIVGKWVMFLPHYKVIDKTTCVIHFLGFDGHYFIKCETTKNDLCYCRAAYCSKSMATDCSDVSACTLLVSVFLLGYAIFVVISQRFLAPNIQSLFPHGNVCVFFEMNYHTFRIALRILCVALLLIIHWVPRRQIQRVVRPSIRHR